MGYLHTNDECYGRNEDGDAMGTCVVGGMEFCCSVCEARCIWGAGKWSESSDMKLAYSQKSQGKKIQCS